ncbi:hypothetical protein EBQ81_00890 [bacterium]|nr:hypothetical protein [bacterium]
MSDRRDFIEAYIECAFWADAEGEDFTGDEMPSDELMERLRADAGAFFDANEADILAEGACSYTGCSPAAYAGHDFWLTRNGHGAGFWDGDWRQPEADRLDAAAKAFGSFDLIAGDDGLIYGM